MQTARTRAWLSMSLAAISLTALSFAGVLSLAGCGSDPAAKHAASARDVDHESAEADSEVLAARSKRKADTTPERRERKAHAQVVDEVSAAEAMLPEGCGDGEQDCLPPQQWVDKLCGGVHPELALHMFRGGSPWKRLYSRATAPAFNGTGGPSLSDERVQRGEELIALRRNSDAKRSNAGEMSVGDTAGYDLLRWNGSCVTLHDGEFSRKPPRRRAAHARVDWRALGDRVQDTLREDEFVSRALIARRKECRGITLGSVTRKCVEQEKSLIKAVVDYVRAGGELPEPSESL
jgi:hypothetical protein